MDSVEKKFPANAIILGFTGSIGSGCSFFAKGLVERFSGFIYCSLSKILKELAKEKGIGDSVEELQTFGNAIRREKGESILVEMLLNELEKDARILEGIREDKIKGFIVDSIRNDGEVKTLRQFPNFYLFSIHADEDIRCKRTVGSRFRNKIEFSKADQRDRAENYSYGQQVKKCNDLADIVLNNNENYPSFHQKDKIFDKLRKYINAIESKIDGIKAFPTPNEALMTIAYATSQSSMCIKRKVGAIIAAIEENPGLDRSPLYSILSSGFNHVPIGSTPCLVNAEYDGKCYRDFLQEQQANTIKFCPKCGKEIAIKYTHICKVGGEKEINQFRKICPDCKKEIDITYTCENCKSEVFNDYLLSAGKLMDMCKSLHAEENALMGITKTNSSLNGTLILFSTTYPCNLCANKIVNAGIKKLVYSDPYPMDDAKMILKNASVDTVKFEGIKSIAFFKIFD